MRTSEDHSAKTLLAVMNTAVSYTHLSYLACSDDRFEFITPDVIYDYFEPLFKKEVYAGEIHQNYLITANILSRISKESLEAKIVKTLSLFYVLGQFDRLKPCLLYTSRNRPKKLLCFG